MVQDFLKKRIADLVEKHALHQGKYTLASGKESNYYLDLDRVTLSHDGILIITSAIISCLGSLKFDSIGGPAIGALPLVVGVLQRKPAIRGFYVRKEWKMKGRCDGMIEGRIKKKDKVVLLEDVTTSGSSVLKAAQRTQEEYNTEVVKIISVIDREEGAAEMLAGEGYKFESILKLSDLSFDVY